MPKVRTKLTDALLFPANRRKLLEGQSLVQFLFPVKKGTGKDYLCCDTVITDDFLETLIDKKALSSLIEYLTELWIDAIYAKMHETTEATDAKGKS